MSKKYVAGPDIDLDTEIVRDKRGRRITEQRAQVIAAETLAKAGVGRSGSAWPARPGTGARRPRR